MLLSFGLKPCHGDHQNLSQRHRTPQALLQLPFGLCQHTSPMHLANVALSVSLASARSTSTMITRMSAISSTAPRHGDARRLGERAPRALTTMGRLGGKSKRFRISNIQTWVRAALTDD
ncbi:unnamed protein product, partial [Musa acuminata var. zebrina]